MGGLLIIRRGLPRKNPLYPHTNVCETLNEGEKHMKPLPAICRAVCTGAAPRGSLNDPGGWGSKDLKRNSGRHTMDVNGWEGYATLSDKCQTHIRDSTPNYDPSDLPEDQSAKTKARG